MASAPILLLTGEAGVGKTTIIQRVIDTIPLRAGGFITGEIREQGRRVGFTITALSGENGTLAHINQRSPYKVGKYFVNLEDLERVGVDALEKALEEDELIVIDEIGKMELYSKQFKDAVRAVLDSGKPVLGSIMFQRSPFADGIKQWPRVEVLEVNKLNRKRLVDEVIKRLKRDKESTGKDTAS